MSAADESVTLEALAERLQQLESRLGRVTDSAATGSSNDLHALDERLRQLEARLHEQEKQVVATTASAAIVSVGSRGGSVKSADGQYELKLRGVVQADGRWFIGDDDANDSVLFRRIRPSLEGSFGPLIGFRLTPELAGDSATILDAYIDLRFNPAYTLRIGKMKGPVGLERLQSASSLGLIERGFPTELAPNREIGVQFQGALAQARINYAVGIYNGAPDGRDSPTSNPDDEFEYAARAFFEPFRGSESPLSGLGFGLAASVGDKQGGGNSFLPRYRTPGQSTFFSYSNAVLADGSHQRWSPQAYWYHHAFGLLAEYIRSDQTVLVPGEEGGRTTLRNTAWQVAASYLLTGETASYNGVKPLRPFDVDGDGWGAFEIAARYGELDIDDDAFPLYANPASAASGSSAWTLGLNWYFTENLKLVINHTRASFDGGAIEGDRNDEKTVFSRVAVAF